MTSNASTPIPTTVGTFPTKQLFVSTLVKDISLARAILDLVDNCVDGAIRLRGDGNFNGLWVRINVTADAFEVHDNCGGIPLEIAARSLGLVALATLPGSLFLSRSRGDNSSKLGEPLEAPSSSPISSSCVRGLAFRLIIKTPPGRACPQEYSAVASCNLAQRTNALALLA